MKADLLFQETPEDDFFAGWATVRAFRADLAEKLRRGSVEGVDDLDAALALAEAVFDDLTAFGTSGGQDLSDSEIALALRALKMTLSRLGVAFDLPFRDYSTFRSYWLCNDGYGSWQARRDILNELFDPLFTRLYSLQERADIAGTVSGAALNALSDASSIRDHLRRLEENVEKDPRAAVSAAKDLVESTAKLVLRERGFRYSGSEDLPPLVARAQKALKLHAKGVSPDTEEAVSVAM